MTLTKRNGTYYIDFFDSFRKPERKRYTLGTRNGREAHVLAGQLQRAYDAREYDPWNQSPKEYLRPLNHSRSTVTWSESIELFLDSRRIIGRRKATIETYADVLQGLMKLVDLEDSPEAIQEPVLVRYIYDTSVAEATQSKRYGHLRTFYKWLSEQCLIARNPLLVVTKPRIRKRLPKSIDRIGLDRIIAQMITDYDHKLSVGQIGVGEVIWRIPLFEFAFTTGMRASELARLRWRDVDVNHRLLSIYEQKNGHEQTIPLSLRALSTLESIGGGEDHEYIFHSPRGNTIRRSSKRFAERASSVFRHYRRDVGLPEGICFHSLRHGFCTALANAGKSSFIIKSVARHKDISTSLRYVHISHRKLLSELDDVFI
jgi:site-specific recombinase XerD